MKDLQTLLFNLVFCLVTIGLLYGARELAAWLPDNSRIWPLVGMVAGCGIYLVWNLAERRRKKWAEQPRLRVQKIATLQLPSGTLVADDAVLSGGPVVVPGFLVRELDVFLETIYFPSGGKRNHRIWAKTGAAKSQSQKVLGYIAVDSATIYLADQEVLEQQWDNNGTERLGELMSMDPKGGAALAQALAERFSLHVRPQTNRFYWEFDERISEPVEEEIKRYVDNAPTDAWFSVVRMTTSNRISRGLRNTPWMTLRFGEGSHAQLVGVVPGLGDGKYPVIGLFVGEQIVGVEIRFFG